MIYYKASLKLCLTYRPVRYLYVPLSTIAIQDHPLLGVQRWAPHLTSCRLSNVVKYGQNIHYTNICSLITHPSLNVRMCVWMRLSIHTHIILDDTGEWCGSKWSEFRFLSCKKWANRFPSDIFKHHQRTSKSLLIKDSSSMRINQIIRVYMFNRMCYH